MNQPYASLLEMEEWAAGVMASRRPDFIIGPGDPEFNRVTHEIPTCPTAQRDYIRRWWIIPRNEYCNLYLHMTLRSDDDRAIHDHPWDNTSFIIAGGYTEITPRYMGSYCGPGNGKPGDDDLMHLPCKPGDVIRRTAKTAHRLVIPEGGYSLSLFATGPKVREWGFWCPQGWRHWQEFTSGTNGESVGLGCD